MNLKYWLYTWLWFFKMFEEEKKMNQLAPPYPIYLKILCSVISRVLEPRLEGANPYLIQWMFVCVSNSLLAIATANQWPKVDIFFYIFKMVWWLCTCEKFSQHFLFQEQNFEISMQKFFPRSSPEIHLCLWWSVAKNLLFNKY